MISNTVPAPARKLMHRLRDEGFEVFAVGGCVRDLLLEKPTKDWDFTTNAKPEDILKLFPGSFYNNIFGTVGVPIRGIEATKTAEVYEITTYRREHGYSDRRHPDKVYWGQSIKEDLARRDFTINAIAYDGERIVDPFQGQNDIKNRLIRAVGDPERRFDEDALRLLRAIRIATELQFLIEEQTFLAIKEDAALIKRISAERIRDELVKILASDFPDDGFMLLKNSGLLQEILPELDSCFGVPQQSPKRHHIYDVGTHLVKSLKECPSKDPILRLATVLHDIGKVVTFKKTEEGVITFYNHELVGASLVYKIADRLHFSRNDRDRLVRLVRYHQFTVDERQTDSAIRRFIRNVGKENLSDILALRIGDRLGGGARETSWRLELFKKRLAEVQKQPFSLTDLKVDGYDVMNVLKISPGPVVGKVLNALFAEAESDKSKNERNYLLKRIAEITKSLVNNT